MLGNISKLSRRYDSGGSPERATSGLGLIRDRVQPAASSGHVRYVAESGIRNQIAEELAVANDGAVQTIDTFVVRVYQHGACIAGNREQHGPVAPSSRDPLGTIQATDRTVTKTLFC